MAPSELLDACARGDFSRLLALLRAGELVNTVDALGNGPLHHAARGGHRGICAKLVEEHFVDVRQRNTDGCTPLETAQAAGFSDLATVLVERELVTPTDSLEDMASLGLLASVPLDKSIRRKRSVSAPENVAPTLLEVPKGPLRERLRIALGRLNLFDDLPSGQLEACVDRFTCATFLPGAKIVSCGTESSSFFVLQEGTLKVYAARSNQEVASITDVGCFGDTSILYERPSAVTVVAETKAVVWCLAKANLWTVVQQAAMVKTGKMHHHMETAVEESATPKHGSPKRGWTRKIQGLFSRHTSTTSHSTTTSSMTSGGSGGSAEESSRTSYVNSTGSSASGSSRFRRNGVDSSGSSTVSGTHRKPKGKKKKTKGDKAEATVSVSTNALGEVELIFKSMAQASHSIVTAGSKAKLFDQFLSNAQDPNFERDFLSTYRNFATSKEVFDFLRAEYEKEAAASVSHKLTSKQHKIVRLLCSWVSAKFRFDPLLEEETRSEILAFAERITEPGIEAMLRNMMRVPAPLADPPPPVSITVNLELPGDIKETFEYPVVPGLTLRDVLAKVSQHKKTAGKFMGTEALEFLMPGFGDSLELNVDVYKAKLPSARLVSVKTSIGAGGLFAHNVTPDVIAGVMTRLDHQTFSRMPLSELRDQVFSKTPDQAPHLKEITDRFNKFCNWAVSSVLRQDRPAERGAMIGKLIDIGSDFYEFRNFHGVMQVLSALKNPALARMRQSWSFVDPNKLSLFQCLDRLINPKDNRGAYRSKLDAVTRTTVQDEFALNAKRSTCPCLPYLGLVLSDMLFWEEGNQTKISVKDAAGASAQSSSNNEELINFSKCRGLARVLDEVRAFQLGTYEHIIPEASFLQLAKSFQWFLAAAVPDCPEDDAYDTSVALEPRLGPSVTPSTPHKVASTPGGDIAPKFNWKTLQNGDTPDMDLNDLMQTNDGAVDMPALDSDGVNWYTRFAQRPPVTYVGFFEMTTQMDCDSPQAVNKFVTEQRKKKVQQTSVYCDVRNDDILLVEQTSKSVIVKKPIERVEFYRYVAEFKIFFFCAEEVNGTRFNHVLVANDNECEEVFIFVHRCIDRWSRTSLQASNKARNEAMASLMDEQHPKQDGTFILRNSSSKPGKYALSVKYQGRIAHYLIERTHSNQFCLKDSEHQFPTLEDLIRFYCVTAPDIPCVLHLEGSQFLTPDCKRPATNTLPFRRQEDAEPVVSYFFPEVDRYQAERLLVDAGMMNGTFLIRPSSSGDDTFALSFVHGFDTYAHGQAQYWQKNQENDFQPRVIHVLISFAKGVWSVDGQPCGESLDEVVSNCQQPSQRILPVPLTRPCPRGTSPAPSSLGSMHSAFSQPRDSVIHNGAHYADYDNTFRGPLNPISAALAQAGSAVTQSATPAAAASVPAAASAVAAAVTAPPPQAQPAVAQPVLPQPPLAAPPVQIPQVPTPQAATPVVSTAPSTVSLSADHGKVRESLV